MWVQLCATSLYHTDHPSIGTMHLTFNTLHWGGARVKYDGEAGWFLRTLKGHCMDEL